MMLPFRSKLHSVVACVLFIMSPVTLGKERPPVPVTTVIAIEKHMPEKITVTGTLRANERVEISPEVAGTVKSLPIKEGDQVKKGDLILQLNGSLFAAQLRQAEASYKLAKIRHNRNTQLLKSNAISQAIYDESTAELNEHKATLEVAQVRLAKTKIIAPFDGFITFRDTTVGAYIRPGEKLFKLVDDRPLKLDFRVPERLASLIVPGKTLMFEVNTTGVPRSYKANIYAIQPAITPHSRTLQVRATFANKNREILSGSFARVHLVLGGDEPVVTVPAEALIGTRDGYQVFVVIDGRAQTRHVTTGVRREGHVAITSGLEKNLPVIVAGHQLVGNGSLVEIVNSQVPEK